MRITYLGEPFTLVSEFPYDIVRQLLIRIYPDADHEAVTLPQVTENPNLVNKSDIVVVQLTDIWVTPLIQLFKSGVIKRGPKYIGHASEITDNYNRKSDYEYYNKYTQKDLDRIVQSGIPSYLDCIIAPSTNPIFGIKNIWYPYLFNPTIWSENIIDSMIDLITKNPRIPVVESSEHPRICMCYKFASPVRDQIADSIQEMIEDSITYSGKYRNNDDSLGPRDPGYSMIDSYYPRFDFSLAIENDYHPSYISEKLIDPLLGGCVPIYYDPLKQFPDRLINRQACYVVNDLSGINKGLLDRVLYNDRPIFAPTALDYYVEWIKSVENTIKNL